jgi:hypothetical protein
MKISPDLPQLSIARLKQAFRQGRAVQAKELQGFYAGVPAGPWWFRLGSGPTMGLTGFAGWLGKQALGQGRAVNLFQSPSGPKQRFPMTLGRRASLIDGQDTLVLNYPADARAPWCWVTDELRWMADGRLLGMTFVDAPWIRHMVFPFVLKPGQDQPTP